MWASARSLGRHFEVFAETRPTENACLGSVAAKNISEGSLKYSNLLEPDVIYKSGLWFSIWNRILLRSRGGLNNFRQVAHLTIRVLGHMQHHVELRFGFFLQPILAVMCVSWTFQGTPTGLFFHG